MCVCLDFSDYDTFIFRLSLILSSYFSFHEFLFDFYVVGAIFCCIFFIMNGGFSIFVSHHVRTHLKTINNKYDMII